MSDSLPNDGFLPMFSSTIEHNGDESTAATAPELKSRHTLAYDKSSTHPLGRYVQIPAVLVPSPQNSMFSTEREQWSTAAIKQ